MIIVNTICRPALTMWHGFVRLEMGDINDTWDCICIVMVFNIFAEIFTNSNRSCEDFLHPKKHNIYEWQCCFFLLIHLPVISIFLSHLLRLSVEQCWPQLGMRTSCLINLLVFKKYTSVICNQCCSPTTNGK